MKYSQLLLTTRKESVSNVDIFSQELLVRAGYIRQLSTGIFTAMHFGQRSFRKIEQILREEMDRIGGVEISMPVVHPAEIWKQTGRYDAIDESLVRFTDRAGRDMVLAMTHEEVVAMLARSEITTYKQLPVMAYQIQTKFRDEARPRGGLIRVREFVMKDSYSLDTSWEGLSRQYQAHYEAYFRIFTRAGLPVVAIESDVGMMGGRKAHEYMYLTGIGEDTIFICENTGYKANKEVATFTKPVPPEEDPLPVEQVHTPGTKTIADLADFLSTTPERCGKVVLFTGNIHEEKKLIIGVVRGDMEVNKVKLQNIVKSSELLPATTEEIMEIGAIPGYASPVGIDRSKAIVVVDDLIPESPNLVMGANEEGYHLVNVCYERDYEGDMVGDITNAYDGALAPDADSEDDTLQSVRGVEVGNIFQLGTKYTEALGANFMDQDGRYKPVIMGSYGIGVGRLLGCIAEEYHEERGLILPITVAPYEVHMVGLLDKPEIEEAAVQVYQQLREAGIEVLYDDRSSKEASAGEKFSDADLIGIPIRLTISKRSLKQGGVEIKLRRETDREVILLDQVVSRVQETISTLKEALAIRVESGTWEGI